MKAHAPVPQPSRGVPGARRAGGGRGLLGLQRSAGNAAVSRLLALQRVPEPEGAPGRRPNLDVGDQGPGVRLLQRMLGASETGTFDAQTRAAVARFQRQQGWDPSGVGPMTWAALDGHEGSPGHRPNLVEGDRGPGVHLLQQLLGVSGTGLFGGTTRKAVDAFQRGQGWDPSGVGPMTWAALDKAQGAAQPDPLQVVVPGTWVDDFAESRYDIDYRIEAKGGPSEWVQVLYDDGTRIDLNWYDFEDVSLTTDQMTAALRARYAGVGGRVFPGRAAGGHLGLTRQLCPRLWAVRDEMAEIGARSTLKLMAGSLAAVTFVLTVPSMAISPPAPDAPATKLRANRRTEPRGGPPGRPPVPGPAPAAKVQAARDYYPGHGGEVGTLEAPGREPMRVKSGVDGGPWGGTHRGGIPRGRGEAFTGGGPSQGNIATHVEGHSAAIMHQQGLREATLTMGRDQCSVCARNLPTALPPGAKLHVVHVDQAGHLSETTYWSNQLPPRR